jgi:hypothetical protein
MNGYGSLYGPNGSGGYVKDTHTYDGMGLFPGVDGMFKNGGYYGDPLRVTPSRHQKIMMKTGRLAARRKSGSAVGGY